MEELRIVRPSPKGMWVTKVCLRTISFTSCIVIFGLAGNIASHDASLFNGLNLVPFAVLAPPTILATCIDFTELVTIFTRSGRRGMHPASHVSVELLIWLGFTIATATLGMLGYAASAVGSAISDPTDDLSNFNRGYTKRGNVTNAVGLGGKGQTFIGFGAVLLVVHFVLFVIACRETNVRNKRTGVASVAHNAMDPKA